MRIEPGSKRLWMIGLLVVAVLAVIYDFHPFVSPAVPPCTTPNASVPKRSATLATDRETGLRLDLLSNQSQMPSLGGRNIFRMQETVIEHKKSPRPRNPGGPEEATEQPEPPLPFTFYGFADKSSEPRRVFLQDSNGALVAKIGDTVAGHYKVIRISQESVVIEDLLRNFQQKIPLLNR